MGKLGFLLVAALGMGGCLNDFPATDDGGVDVGNDSDLSGVFGVEDGAIVPQDDLLGFGSTGDGGVVRYHPLGFSASNVHGPEMKLSKQDCRLCHGSDLTGGSSQVSCDSCHSAGWRTNCIFCHGGANGDTTGLPPRDINEQTDPTKISFPAHAVHAKPTITSPMACTQCHKPNLSVLTAGHIFDKPPLRAVMFFQGGLSPTGTYDQNTKTCGSLYCHGDGQTGGSVVFNAPKRTCHDCHPDMTTPNLWATMSGRHRLHLGLSGVNCTWCHNGTVATDPGVVTGVAKHVDGKRNIQFSGQAGTIAFDVNTKRCTGSCHGQGHNNTW